MPDKPEFITVLRSADSTAEEDAANARERLAQDGIYAIVLGDDAPGIVEGTWEVRVAPSDVARAEAVLAAPAPTQEDEAEVSEEGLSEDLDFVSIFSAQGIEAEMEAISIQSVLKANGIPCTVIGSAQIPSLPFEVRVPKSRAQEASTLLEEVRQAGAGDGE